MTKRITPADMPPVTDAHRRAAFEAMHWTGWKFEAAMQFDMRRRFIEARAHAIRTAEWEKTTQRRVVPVRRVRLGADGHPVSWCTQLVLGPRESTTQPELDL
jgi:hypothetical protein